VSGLNTSKSLYDVFVMAEKVEAPSVRPGGLVTVAFLKARLDEGSDHLGIFMPLVLDVLTRVPAQTFTTGDIQEALAASHGVAMPQQTVTTLLKRATANKYLSRESGRYKRNATRDLPSFNVAAEKAQIEEGQRHLAEARGSWPCTRRVSRRHRDVAPYGLCRWRGNS